MGRILSANFEKLFLVWIYSNEHSITAIFQYILIGIKMIELFLKKKIKKLDKKLTAANRRRQLEVNKAKKQFLKILRLMISVISSS